MELQDVERMEGRGLSSVKFTCRRGSERLLLRINENVPPEVGLARFEKAAYCVRVCREVGVPVAEILEVGLRDGRPYSLERWVDGTPADLVRDERARTQIWRTLGKAIRPLHTAPLEAPPPLGYDGDGPTEAWAEHLPSVLAILERDTHLGLTELQKDRLAGELERLDLSPYPPGLNHGDLKLDNVLVHPDTLELVAILDWELARLVPAPLGEYSTSIEPAVLELKTWAIARGPAERAALLAGLGYGPEQERDFLLFYTSDVLMNLGWYATAQRPDMELLRLRFARYLEGVRADVLPYAS